jgi:hypothetical protein
VHLSADNALSLLVLDDLVDFVREGGMMGENMQLFHSNLIYIYIPMVSTGRKPNKEVDCIELDIYNPKEVLPGPSLQSRRSAIHRSDASLAFEHVASVLPRGDI